MILVQSAVARLGLCLSKCRFLLAAPPEAKVFEPAFAEGAASSLPPFGESDQEIGNPARRTQPRRKQANRTESAFLCQTEELLDWLGRPAEPPGFCIDKDSTTVQPGYIYVNKRERQEGSACARSATTAFSR